MSESIHVAVMTNEAIEALSPHAGGRYLDCTLGGGTHTATLLEKSAPDGKVMSLDIDRTALERASARFAPYGDRWTGVEGNFRHLATIVRENGFQPLDGILIDLGFSSDELENPFIGLSFQTDGPLDMRLGLLANEDGLTAADVINSWRPSEIERVLREYGEESWARKIVDEIVHVRKKTRITTTVQLAELIKNALPRNYERGRIHPATRTFQALRIVVNDELETLRLALAGAEEVLAPEGRIAVISFHSLEDRVIKQYFRDSDGLEAVTKKPLVPSEEELFKNPRARSAKLRVAVKSQKSKKPKSKYESHVRPLYDESA